MVGRETELAALQDALDDPACGGVAFVGGPGFGKTRLANRAVELIGDRDILVASVRATRSAVSIPFAALAQLFDQLGIVPGPDVGLLRSVVDSIDRLRGDRRMALVVDDAQELDGPSSALLEQLVRWAGLFIVFTVRSGRRSANAVTGIWDDERIRCTEVGPLPETDLRSLAMTAIGGAVDGSTLKAIVTASEGNPLFLRELIQGALEAGSLTSELGLWRLRGSLADSLRLHGLIEQRLAGLDQQEREALELVVLSDPAELALLERLVSLEALETLEDRGLIDVVDGNPGLELHIHHPLYGEVVRAQLPSLRRARQCRALADAAEAMGATHGPEALRVAVWRLDGGEIGNQVTTLEAARAALRSADHALAARLAQVAWQKWGSVDAALILGDALDALGRGRDAERVLGRAATVATTDRQRTNLAVRRAAVLFRSLGDAEEADRVVVQTSESVTDPACRREIDALRGNHLLLTGDVAKAMVVSTPILLQPGGAAFAQASLDVGTGLALAGRTKDAIVHTNEALAARVGLDHEEQLSTIGIYLVAQTLAHLHAGNLEQAAAIGDAGYQVSIDKVSADGQAWFASIMGLVLLAKGRPASAGNLFREAATLFGELRHPGRRWGLGGIALASAHLGVRADGLEALAELDDTDPTPVHLQDVGILRGRAWTAVTGGEMTAARTLFWEAAELGQRWGQFAAAAEALHDLSRVGVLGPATEGLERIADLVDGAFMPARLAFARAASRHAPQLAGDAADQFEAIGAQLFAAESAALESRLATAEGLHRRAAAADARSERLLGCCEGASTPGLARSPTGRQLTPREHEVALLAAQDLTSRQIAQRLFVSARTVDNHLQRIYTKLGITGRDELPTLT